MHTEFLVENAECKRPLGRSGCRWERIVLKWMRRKLNVEGFDCIKLAQDMDRWRALMFSAHSKKIDWTKNKSLL